MATFRISLLLAFCSSPLNFRNEEPQGTNNTKKSPKKTNKTEKSNDTLRERKMNSMKYEEHVLETGSPIGHAHIEYELIPGKPKQSVDVVCWNKVAKVFVEEETLTFRCKTVNEIVWVPVCIQHQVNSLETTALTNFHKHTINFLIFTNKQKLDVRAKSENTKRFYIREEHVRTDDVVLAYTEDPNIGDATLENVIHEIISECIYKPDITNQNEVVSKINLKDEIHTFRMNEIIEKISAGEKMCFKEYIPISLPPSNEDENTEGDEENIIGKAKAKRTVKKRKDGQQNKELKSGGVLRIKVNAEVFFTNPMCSIFDLKQGNSVIWKAFVLLSVDHLMTVQQKYELNPLIIRINKIDNLPADVLNVHRFKSVFVRYNIPRIAQAKTMEKNIEYQIRINEAHAHFTNEIPNIRFLEFIASERLRVEVCGVLDDSSGDVEGSLFGSDESDRLLWKKMTPYVCSKLIKSTDNPVVLAVACYDLSSLLMPTWGFLFNEPCHNPDNLLVQKPPNPHASNKFEHITPATINLNKWYRKQSESPLTEVILSEHQTCLEVEVLLVAPCVHIKSDASFYIRMFLTLYDKNMAVSLLNELLVRNQYLNKEIVAKSPLQRTLKNEPVKSEYITGFVIDNFEQFSFFIEGLEGNVVHFWNEFSNKRKDEVKVFHNSFGKFEKRLYADFLPVGGVYVITLHKALRDILALPRIYVQGNVPIPCWQALKKLDLLYRCYTSKDMQQLSLFPTPEELYSLDLEFGVPLRWKERVQRQARRGTLVETFQ